MVWRAGHAKGLVRSHLGSRRGIPSDPGRDPTFIDQHPPDRGRDHLRIASMAALVHRLAGSANDRTRPAAALRSALPVGLARIDKFRPPHTNRTPRIPYEGTDTLRRLEMRWRRIQAAPSGNGTTRLRLERLAYRR